MIAAAQHLTVLRGAELLGGVAAWVASFSFILCKVADARPNSRSGGDA